MKFHYPIFNRHGNADTVALEKAVLTRADDMLKVLRLKQITNLTDAITEILKRKLPSGQGDKDLGIGPGFTVDTK